MNYFDTYKRNFQRWSSKYIERHLEDPSYVGFLVKFSFDEGDEIWFDDTIPGGLLYTDLKLGIDTWIDRDKQQLRNTLTTNSKYSALNYLTHLENAGILTLNQKTDLLRALIYELHYIQTKTPWFFNKISGLENAYKINHEGFRLNGSETLTIETLESIDKRVTFIIDAYRRIAWDMKSMSWLLPENMRKFSMEIIITEFNGIHTKNNLYELSTEAWGDIAKFLDNVFPGAYNTIKKLQAKTNTVKDLFSNIASGNISEIIASLFILDKFTKNQIQIFRLGGCEFDVLGDFSIEYLGDISAETAGEPITNKLPIKFTKSNVITVNNLFGYISDDYGKNFEDNSILFNYDVLYNYERDENAQKLLVKRAKDVAQSILGGHYNPLNAIRNNVTGNVENIGNIYRDLL